jgi:hypothetical protein
VKQIEEEKIPGAFKKHVRKGVLIQVTRVRNLI